MPTKKEEVHDCKKDCELLHKEIADLKKEVAALKAELKKAPKGGGGADPRLDALWESQGGHGNPDLAKRLKK
jgi:hypothetical protein